MHAITTLLLVLISLCAGLPSRRRLTQHISHHDTLNYDTSAVQQQHERMRRSDVAQHRWKPLKIRFTALDREFSLVMFPNHDIIAPGADFLVYSADGPRKADFDPSALYKGTLESERDSSVHGYIVDGVFDGVIVTSHEEYHVELAGKFFDQVVDFHSVIYATSDVDFRAVNGSTPLCGGTGTAYEKLKKLQSTAKPVVKQNNKFRTKKALSSTNRFCPILIAADELFVQNVGRGSEVTAMNEITGLVTSVNTIFSVTDFDLDGDIDAIGFLIRRISILRSSMPGYRYGASSISVTDFLDLWSQENHDAFCLAMLLTYRDFDNGVLGLAWVAEPPGGNRGGICETRLSLSIGERNLNSAIVTFLNFGTRQPRPVTIITMAHEFGHNFGSPHDPNPSAMCSPGGSQGNFLMFPSATDGNLPNNNAFSTCSRRSMLAVLTSKSTCFVRDREICGNGIVEGDEVCDCGSDDTAACDMEDPCCTTNCTLKPMTDCTPMNPDTPCCSAQCMVVPANTMMCAEATDCARAVMCNVTGTSAVCPNPDTNADKTLCNSDRNTCLDGVCSGSICLLKNFTECQCTEPSSPSNRLCDICCNVTVGNNSRCESTFTLENITGTRRESGRSCNEFRGYCDSDGTCVGVNSDDVLNQIKNIFTIDNLNNVVEWLKDYWWIILIIGLVIIGICIALPLTYRKKKPIRKILRRASTLRRPSTSNDVNTIANAQAGGIGTSRQRVARRRDQSRQPVLTANEGLQRLKRFFPTVDNDTIMSVMRAKKNEEKSVKQLLALGFPLKKQP